MCLMVLRCTNRLLPSPACPIPSPSLLQSGRPRASRELGECFWGKCQQSITNLWNMQHFSSFYPWVIPRRPRERQKIDLRASCVSSQAGVIPPRSLSSCRLTCDCAALGRCGTKITNLSHFSGLRLYFSASLNSSCHSLFRSSSSHV